MGTYQRINAWSAVKIAIYVIRVVQLRCFIYPKVVNVVPTIVIFMEKTTDGVTLKMVIAHGIIVKVKRNGTHVVAETLTRKGNCGMQHVMEDWMKLDNFCKQLM